MFKQSILPKVEMKTVTINGGRYYVTPSGAKYPSVTTVLGRGTDMRWLWGWRKRVGEAEANRVSKLATTKGTAIHNLCEKFLLNSDRLPFFLNKAMPTTLQSWKHVRPVLESSVREVYGVEFPLYSDVLWTAGRADGIVDWLGKRVILDFKTTKSAYPKSEEDILNYFLQTTAYGIMTEERTGMSIDGVVVVMISEFDRPQVFARPLNKYRQRTIDFFKENSMREVDRLTGI